MRNKAMLSDIRDIDTLLTYLYMDEKHAIILNNGLTNLKITMDENGDIQAENLSFPGTKFPFSNDFTIATMLAAIQQQQDLTPEMPNTQFQSRWEEIKTIAGVCRVLNL